MCIYIYFRENNKKREREKKCKVNSFPIVLVECLLYFDAIKKKSALLGLVCVDNKSVVSDDRGDLALIRKLVDDSHGKTGSDLHAVGDGGGGDELHPGDVLKALVESSLVLEENCVIDLVANLCLRPLLLGSLGTLLCTWSSGHL